MATLWEDGDVAEAWKMNKLCNAGQDEDKGSPTTIGEAYISVDTGWVYVSLDGSEWTHKFQLTAV
jgi:hypothetical protein